jgi:hypothetical protein
MDTLRILTVGMLFAAATTAAAAASEQPIIETITVTAKRHATESRADRVAPQSDVAFTVIMPTDMPEAEIDFHLSPIGAVPPAPAVERATL